MAKQIIPIKMWPVNSQGTPIVNTVTYPERSVTLVDGVYQARIQKPGTGQVIQVKLNPSASFFFRWKIWREDGDFIQLDWTSPVGGDTRLTWLDVYNSSGTWIETTTIFNTELGLWETELVNPNEADPIGYWVDFLCDYGVVTEYPRHFKTSDKRNTANLIQPGYYYVTIPYFKRDYTKTQMVTGSTYSCSLNVPDITLSDGPWEYTDYLFKNIGDQVELKWQIQSTVGYKIKHTTTLYTAASVQSQIPPDGTFGYICANEIPEGKVDVISSALGTTVHLGLDIESPPAGVVYAEFDPEYPFHTEEKIADSTTTITVSNPISVVCGVWLVSTGRTGRNYLIKGSWTESTITLVTPLPTTDLNVIVDYIENPDVSYKNHTVTFVDVSAPIANRWLAWADKTVNVMRFDTRPWDF